MMLKVQGVWEAERLLDALTFVALREWDECWINDVTRRLKRQIDAEKERRSQKKHSKIRTEGNHLAPTALSATG